MKETDIQRRLLNVDIFVKCPTCKGTGIDPSQNLYSLYENECGTCKGTGHVRHLHNPENMIKRKKTLL